MNERHLAGLATVGLLLLSTGCAANGDPDPAPDPAADVTATSDDGRGALRTVSVEASRYFDPTTPDSIRQWGSYLALVTLTGDSEIPQVINPAPGGPEEPMAGPSMRGLDFRVDEVLWTNPQAISELTVGDSINTETGDGYTEVDGEVVAVLTDGSVPLEVGQSYVVALVDDLAGGQQVLEYLDGSALEPGTATTELVSDVRSQDTPGNSDNVPTRGVSFDERIIEYAVG